MSRSARRVISAVHIARPVGALEFQDMRRIVLMIWLSNFTMHKLIAKVHRGSYWGMEKMSIFLRHLDMNRIIGFHARQVGISLTPSYVDPRTAIPDPVLVPL